MAPSLLGCEDCVEFSNAGGHHGLFLGLLVLSVIILLAAVVAGNASARAQGRRRVGLVLVVVSLALLVLSPLPLLLDVDLTVSGRAGAAVPVSCGRPYLSRPEVRASGPADGEAARAASACQDRYRVQRLVAAGLGVGALVLGAVAVWLIASAAGSNGSNHGSDAYRSRPGPPMTDRAAPSGATPPPGRG